MIWAIIVLFIAAILLVLGEFIVPGGVLGLIGGVLVLVSCALGVMYTSFGLFIILGELIGMAASIGVGMYILSHTRAANIMTLSSQQNIDEGWAAPSEDPSLVGATGEVLTALRPAGTILVNDRRIDAVSDGVFIEKGMAVQVVEVAGIRVVVEAKTTN